MKRLLAGIVLLLLIGAAGGVAVRAMVTTDPVYSVSQVDAALRRHPAALVGRVIWVRGVVGFCPIRAGCPQGVPPILSPHLGQISPDPPLQLSFGTGDSLEATVRRLPVLGALLPPPARLIDGYQGALRVRIEPTSKYACFERLCYQGVLQDVVAP